MHQSVRSGPQEMLADFPQIWLYLLKKFLMENFIFCEVTFTMNLTDI